jgi:hypothetical protein
VYNSSLLPTCSLNQHIDKITDRHYPEHRTSSDEARQLEELSSQLHLHGLDTADAELTQQVRLGSSFQLAMQMDTLVVQMVSTAQQ